MFNFDPQKREMMAQKEAEERHMQFQREQNNLALGSQEGHIELREMEHKADLIKWQQELDDELQDLIYQLKGYKKENGGWYVPEKPKPLCNDTFIEKIVVPQVRPFLARYSTNSNLSEERILNSLKMTCDEIADNMADGYDLYDISFIDFDEVLRLIKNVITPCAFRSLHGWTKKTDSTNFKRIESSFDRAEQPQNKRFFGIA